MKLMSLNLSYLDIQEDSLPSLMRKNSSVLDRVLNPTEQLWDKLECRLCPTPSCLILVPNLDDAPVAECGTIIFQN